ncbi:uncharacterized protein [Chironomus tepperi]|uniref:uncharacterized protein n=1 Tax=Chironomus tepperi TaxID=113505 RepID=UPI00391F140D
MEEIDKALLKYDFDSTACTQRVLCWYVKESIVNIEENRPSVIDYLIETLTNSDWVQNMLSNTAWNTAISVAKRGQNCETTFSACKLSPSSLDNFTHKIMNYARRK